LCTEGAFTTFSYDDAVGAREARHSTKKGYGPKEGKVHLTKKQEETIWVGLVSHLEQQDKLPVIAFTLSRNRCDQNSQSLTSVDLTTKSEKNFIRKFFDRSIQNLKEPDQLLPQVYILYSYNLQLVIFISCG
jgi:antiviral helicase SKI2